MGILVLFMAAAGDFAVRVRRYRQLYTSTGGSCEVSLARSAVAFPLSAYPRSLPDGSTKSDLTPSASCVTCHSPRAPPGGGDTMVGHACVFTRTGIAG